MRPCRTRARRTPSGDSRVVGLLEVGRVDLGAGVAGQVGRARHQGRNEIEDGIEARTAGVAGGDLFTCGPRRQLLLPARKTTAVEASLERLVVAPTRFPRRAPLLPRPPEGLTA